MKTEEDEAFDELAKRQGMWGGGFQAKRAAAADKLHWSDCAVHNGPAYPAGECDCGAAQKREWVGLTDEERNDCLVKADPCECLADPEAHQLMVEVEAMLKEKNT